MGQQVQWHQEGGNQDKGKHPGEIGAASSGSAQATRAGDPAQDHRKHDVRHSKSVP